MRIPIMVRLAGRYIRRRLLQSILFVIGVALGVAVVIAIDLANNSASRAFELSTISVTGRATHQIIGGPNGLPSELYRQLRIDLGLRQVAPVVEEYLPAADLGNRPLRLLGVDPFAEPPFRSYLSEIEIEGENQNAFEALNNFIAQPNTALISDVLAERLQPRETIALLANGQRTELTLVGVLQTVDTTSAQALESLVLTDIATAQEILGMEGAVSRIDLIVPEGFDIAQIEALMPPGARLTTPRAQSSAIGQMTDAFELNLQALSLLALVVGVFLIYNTVSFSVVQRRAILGVLRALGATKRQIFTLILGEAIILGIIGTVLGLGLGIIFGRGAVGLVSQTISDLYFTVSVSTLTVDPFTLLKGVAIGVAASVFAALIPSLDATRTAPAGSLRRSSLEESMLRLLPYLTLFAAGLCLVGALLLTLPTQNLFISFGALFSIVVGGALLTPFVLVVFMRLFTPIGDRLFGVLGRMAPRAVSRSLSRTSVAVAALTVAVSVIVGISVMIASFRTTVSEWLDNTLGADIYISPPSLTATRAQANIEPAIADRIRPMEGVARVVTGRNVELVAPDYPDLPPVNVTASTGEVVSTARRFAWLNAASDQPADYYQVLLEGNVLVSEPFAFRRGITPENNQLRLLTDRGEQPFTVAGVFYDFSTDQGFVYMADSIYRQYFDDPYISSIAVFLEPDANADAILERIRAEAIPGLELVAQGNRSLRQSVFEVFERTFAITAALRLLAVVVAFIGILSALMSLQLEQTRQYGTMRAIGLTPRQLWQYTLIQTGLMGTTAGLLALPIGGALAWVLIYVINVRSFGWTMGLILTPEEFILAFAVAVIAALLAGLYPARRLMGLVTAQALRSE